MNTYILKKIIFPLADFIMKTKIIHYYNQIKIMEGWHSDKINKWQDEKLKKLIHHAYSNTEYYKNLFDEIGLKPEDIKSKSDLQKIPILTKEKIIKDSQKLISKNSTLIPHKASSTGGSTGDPMKYLLDIKSWSFSSANNIVHWEKTNYNFGDKHIALGSTSLFLNKSASIKHKIFYKLKNRIGLNGVNMSDDICKNYIEFIKRRKVKYIYGYASTIYLLAKYVANNNISIQISACFPTSEILTDLYRTTIKESFNCEIVNCYGANDGGITAFEHEIGNFEVGYNSIVRVHNIKDESIIKGPVLLTDLLNYAMPLINYQLGDEVKMKEGENKYNGQVIEKVYGRTSDVIRLENGNVLTGPGFTILFKDLPVEAYSITKSGKNSLLCKIKKLSEFSEIHEKLVITTLKKNAGVDAEIKIEYVDKFELTSSGKKRYFITS